MSLLAAVKAQKAKEESEKKAADGGAPAKKEEPKKEGEAAAEEAPPAADFGSIVKLLNMKKLQKSAAADLRPKKPKRRYSLPDSLEKIER